MMEIIVYFETPNNSYAEIMAQFADEELYMACLPVLEAKAKELGMIITESLQEKGWEIRYDDSGESERYGEGRWFVADENGMVLGDESFHTKQEAEDFLKECLENENV